MVSKGKSIQQNPEMSQQKKKLWEEQLLPMWAKQLE